VDERFVLSVPSNLPLAGAAPLLEFDTLIWPTLIV
jgi:hypothetical protein